MQFSLRSLRRLYRIVATGLSGIMLSTVAAHAQTAEIIIDNNDPEAYAVSGNWWVPVGGAGFVGSDHLTLAEHQSGEFRWTPGLDGAAGMYDVYVRYVTEWWNLGSQVPYAVAHDDGLDTIVVDQTQNGGTWVQLGRFAMSPGSYVSVSNSASDGWRPSADAVRLVPVSQPTAPEQGLNVLFVTVDDLRPELGAYGESAISTPNIDALAQQGTTFTRAFAQMSTCSPSRTSMLTGLRPDAAGVTDLSTHFRTTVPGVVTLPQYFKNRGYRTQAVCKVYHGGLEDPLSWSVPHQNASGPRLEPGPDGKTLPFAAVDGPQSQFADHKCADLAIDAINESAARDAPFFLAVGFKKPHLPFVAPKAYFDRYDRNAIPLAPNRFQAVGAPEMAFENRSEIRTYSGIPPVPEPLGMELVRDLKHAYYAATSFVDAQVGRVLAALEANGLGDNTVVVLVGDHGFHLGEQDDWGKHTNFDVGTRTPLIIRMPGSTGNQSTAALAELVDLYPTIVELAGLPLPTASQRGGYAIQGDSLARFIAEPSAASRRGAFSQWSRGGYAGYSVRTDRYRFTEWRKGEDTVLELYDHDTDPNETLNVAYLAENASIVKELRSALSAGGKVDLPGSLR